MGTFAVTATIANPALPGRSLTLDLLVDTGASWTLLPEDIVRRLELAAPSHRSVALASGEQVTYAAGQVAIELAGEQMITLFLVGPHGSRPLLGGFTLEGFGLASDPVKKVLVPVQGLLAALEPER